MQTVVRPATLEAGKLEARAAMVCDLVQPTECRAAQVMDHTMTCKELEVQGMVSWSGKQLYDLVGPDHGMTWRASLSAAHAPALIMRWVRVGCTSRFIYMVFQGP